MRHHRRTLAALVLPAIALVAGSAALLGCASIIGANFDRPEDDGSINGGDDDEGGAPGTGTDAGDGGHATTDSGKRDASAGADGSPVQGGDDDDDGPEAGVDAALDSGTHLDSGGDAGHVVDCSTKTSPGVGDFVVTELLIETQTDEADDPGQWLEVTNVSGCPLPLANLEVFSPNSRHSEGDMVQIAAGDTTSIPSGGTFVVANVAAPPGITGKIYSFDANGTLESGDDTVYIYLNTVTISSLELQWADCESNETPCYHQGHSIELPPGCTSKDGYASNWKESDHMYGMTTGGLALYGTPNASNSDQTACTP